MAAFSGRAYFRFIEGGLIPRLMSWNGIPASMPCSCGNGWIQVRYKKGAGRYKVPPAAKEKVKWVSMRKPVKQKIMPKNWDTKFMTRVPEDDVWIRTYYPPQKYTLKEALKMHAEYAAPEMTDNLDGLVYFTGELDMRTKKKTKFMSGVRDTVLLPHQFDDGTENRVVAFCKTPEEKQLADEMGAVFAGGIDLIKTFEKGEIRKDEFDIVVSTPEMIPELTKIRKFFKDGFPHKNRGTLSGNLEEMLLRFIHGKTYQSKPVTESVSNINVCLGMLNMPVEQLEDNYMAYLEAICGARSKELGPFILQGHVTCPPSWEKFHLKLDELLPYSQRAQPVAALHQEEEQESVDSDDEAIGATSR